MTDFLEALLDLPQEEEEMWMELHLPSEGRRPDAAGERIQANGPGWAAEETPLFAAPARDAAGERVQANGPGWAAEETPLFAAPARGPAGERVQAKGPGWAAEGMSLLAAPARDPAPAEGGTPAQGPVSVRGGALVQGFVTVEGRALVQGSVPVKGGAPVQGSVPVEGGAPVQGSVPVEGGAPVQGSVLVESGTPVRAGAWPGGEPWVKQIKHAAFETAWRKQGEEGRQGRTAWAVRQAGSAAGLPDRAVEAVQDVLVRGTAFTLPRQENAGRYAQTDSTRLSRFSAEEPLAGGAAALERRLARSGAKPAAIQRTDGAQVTVEAGTDLEELDRRIRRDARRYDGAMTLY